MKTLSILVLSIWFLLSGAISILSPSFHGLPLIMSVLAIAAGILLLLTGKKTTVLSHLGALLLGIYLIAHGLIRILNVSFTGMHIIMGLLAVVAAIMILLNTGGKKKKGKLTLGAVFTAVWLVITGLILLISFSFSGIHFVVGILAILAGLFLLIKK